MLCRIAVRRLRPSAMLVARMGCGFEVVYWQAVVDVASAAGQVITQAHGPLRWNTEVPNPIRYRGTGTSE